MLLNQFMAKHYRQFTFLQSKKVLNIICLNLLLLAYELNNMSMFCSYFFIFCIIDVIKKVAPATIIIEAPDVRLK